MVSVHTGVKPALVLGAILGCILLSRPAQAVNCTCVPCDFDHDGDVDLTDFAHLQYCISGFGNPQLDPACQDAKLAGHSYIDKQDLAIFKSCLSGEQISYPGMELPAVVISELSASNDSGLVDEDGDHSDWVEIHVPCLPSINLEGWFLTDDLEDLQKWSFPAVTISRSDYLVVFVSGKDRRTPGQPLHTNFSLGKDGEYLALVAPDGQTVVHAYTPKFPEQLTDVSYGLAEVSIRPLMKGTAARYHVPTQADAGAATTWMLPGFEDSAWASGATGLGFSTLPSVFNVTVYRANIFIGDLTTAESVIATPSYQIGKVTAQVPTINFWNSGAEGHFVNNQPYPGMDLVTDVDNFALLVTGTLIIPYAGEWTFGINSDDGFSLSLTQGTHVYTSNYPSGRGASDTLATFNITSPGVYALRMVQFEGGGGSSFEFFAAPGYYETFDASAFRLVGDVAGGGLGLGGVGWDVQTDIGTAMRDVNSSVWIRQYFTMEDPGAYSGMKLSIRYADGFVAYLNGTEIARRLAPGSLTWNSAATSKRTDQQASITEDIDLAGYYNLLLAGTNLLAIQGLNDTAADGDFAIVPEVIVYDNSIQAQYFTTPSPGKPNSPGMLGFVKPVEFDQQRSFRTAAFQLTLTCPTPGATIHYTLDGSTPDASGTLYTGPLTISRTTVLRAAAFKANWLPSPSMTHTFLYVNDILQQSPNGEAPGPGWPAPGSVNDQVINYGMDPQIIKDTRYSSLMDDALLAIPTISLVTDLPNLFSQSAGIYTHAGNDGRAWERPCSVELINPSGKAGFQINAGLRIRGGFSRGGWDPKHGFRLLFRSEYGQKSLDYPLFENEGVTSFRKVDLRCEQNYSWQLGDSRNTAVREIYVRDSLGAMGEPYSRSRYYHLYLDGVYWGLYSTEERMEADFAASYFGGTDNDYDVIKQGSYATDGTTDAWYRLWQACQAGLGTDEAYYKVQGLNADGTRNESYEVLVDVDNTIDCALLTYFSGDLDGPISAFGSNASPNNFVAIRNRNGLSGFKCFKHDCEHTLLDPNEDRTGPWPEGGNEFWKMNPQYLSQVLAAHPEYRVRFGDRAQRFLFNGGVLTAANNIARFQARAAQVRTAIIAESARWGDYATEPPFNRDSTWVSAINWVVNSYFPVRNAILINQLKADGLYPSVPAPLISSPGGQVASGYKLTLSTPSGTTGTICYTTDGTDPRLRGGSLSGSASVFQASSAGSDAGTTPAPDPTIAGSQSITIDRNMTVKTRILDGTGQWSALVEATFVTQPVALVINEFMADNSSTIEDPDEPGKHPDWIEIYNPNPMAMDMGGMYLSDDFDAPTKFAIPSGVSIPARGYKVFWADGDTTQGSLHTNFSLSKGGERIRLTAADGVTVLDQIIFGAQTTDVSYGRYPDGTATWGLMASPTPWFANNGLR